MPDDESLREHLARIEGKIDGLLKGTPRPGLLTPMREIAAYVRRQPRCVRQWAEHRDFPLIHLANNEAASTVTLIDRWLLEQRSQELALPPHARKWHRGRIPKSETDGKRYAVRQGRRFEVRGDEAIAPEPAQDD